MLSSLKRPDFCQLSLLPATRVHTLAAFSAILRDARCLRSPAKDVLIRVARLHRNLLPGKNETE